MASLEAALASIQRGNPVSAINQLSAFQNKVRSQVRPRDPALAATFITAGQEILDALQARTVTEETVRTAGSLPSLTSLMGGRKCSSSPRRDRSAYVEASTDLVTWEAIGLATDQDDGTFAFEDHDATRFPRRYYRTQQLPRQ